MLRIIVKFLALIIIGILIVIPSFFDKQHAAWYRNQVAVLMYHHVDDTVQSSATIRQELLHDQLAYLLDKGYQFITIEQFRQFLAGEPVPANAVFVTYDDGYESFYHQAYEVHRKLQVPAVNFLITQHLDNPRQQYIPYLSREQAQQLIKQADVIDLQCHTHALHQKTATNEAYLIARLNINDRTETEEEYELRIRQDTHACFTALQDINPKIIDSLAYPYGIYDKKAIDLLTLENIKYAYTVEPGIATRQTNHYQIPRINAGSPWITPKGLHHTILHHLAVVPQSEDLIALEPYLEQWGGSWERYSDGRLHIRIGEHHLSTMINSDKLIYESLDESVRLTQPIRIHNGHIVMLRDDLSALFGPAT